MKYQKFVVVGDNHGDRADVKSCTALFQFIKHWKPQIRVHLGDCFDFRCFRRGGSDEEKRDKIAEDLDTGTDFLRKFQPTTYMLGNHERRVWDLLDADDKKISKFANYIITDINEVLGDVVPIPYDKRAGVYRIGNLKVIHGFNAGIYAVRQSAMIYGSVLMGHIHAIDSHSIPGLEPRTGRSIGCLCALDMDYNRTHTNTLRQAHGWGYGLLFADGKYQYWQAESVAGRWFFPSEIRECA